jgi:molybdate transport system ATP-binding protein
MHPLIELTQATVTRGGTRLAGPLTFSLCRGESVAVTGPNGAGKTTLLRLLRGELPPDEPRSRTYDFGDGPQRTPLGLRQRIAMVSADMQDFYFLHGGRTPGRSVVLAGFFDTPLLYDRPTPEQEAAADDIIKRMSIADLAKAGIGSLSTGQVRKLLLARALAPGPDVLLLDEWLDGLDASSRAEGRELLARVAGDAALVCAAHRAGDLPRSVDRVLAMEGGRILSDGPGGSGLGPLRETAPAAGPVDFPTAAHPPVEYLLRMRNVSVVVDGTRILNRIDWEVLPGENWLVLGENGAGKSTLLKLVTSELAPYADDVDGVGQVERLGGMTMEEARPLIGVVSPALQASYGRELGWEVTALETVLSGCRGSVGMLDEPTDRELLAAREWLDRAGLAGLEDRGLRRMSYGQQRRVFLARAMVSSPRLLLLDEPFSGLDPASRAGMRAMVQKLAEAGTPLVLVTHHLDDRIPAVNRVLLLEEGESRFCGSLEEFKLPDDGTD